MTDPLADALTGRYTGRPQSYERHFNRMINAGFLEVGPFVEALTKRYADCPAELRTALWQNDMYRLLKIWREKGST